MTTYSFDNKSLFKDGKRWFPVMGEIHYSRYPRKYWKEALLKMKEGGVDIVSSYVIWIHHEEVENEWDWSGDRDLRSFIETIKECGLSMILRIGPWSHAEVRNGGFPDWLLGKCPEVRTNNEAYLAEVKKFYTQIFEQVKGLLLKDGGPVIGVQIENEFGHCGGLWGEEGEHHMKLLTKMARETGFDVPLYTATGWGGAVTGGLLPVMGGYCEAPWDPRTTEIEPSVNYVFTYERNDHGIGSDYGLGEGISFDMTKFPYLTAELGGGLQVTYKRRPVALKEDIGGMSLAKMGSGCNLLGYYMYHGGCNPEGKLTTLEENTATGSINDLPVKNYDFRAPLGEYGKPNGTYDEIKLYTLFVHDFGEGLAHTDTYILEDNPIDSENLKDIRSSWRYCKDNLSGKETGFLFVNNYQRRNKMAEHKHVIFKNENASVEFPPVDIKDGDMFFLPFNMKVEGSLLKKALVTPLCCLNNEEKDYVFYSTVSPAGKEKVSHSSVKKISELDSSIYDFENDDSSVKIITLTKKEALKAHKVKASCGKEFLFITDAVLYSESVNEKTVLHFETNKTTDVKVYPLFKDVPEGLTFKAEENGFGVYTLNAGNKIETEVKPVITEKENKLTAEILTDAFTENDMLLEISYTGNCARFYENGKLKDDSIFTGEDYKWNIWLKRFGNESHKFTIEVDPLYEKQKETNFIEKWPVFKSDRICEIKSIKLVAEKKTDVIL